MLEDSFIPDIEKKSGETTKEFVALAVAKGLGDPTIKPGVRMAWLKEEFGLGHGHAMTMAHAIKTALTKKTVSAAQGKQCADLLDWKMEPAESGQRTTARSSESGESTPSEG